MQAYTSYRPAGESLQVMCKEQGGMEPHFLVKILDLASFWAAS